MSGRSLHDRIICFPSCTEYVYLPVPGHSNKQPFSSKIQTINTPKTDWNGRGVPWKSPLTTLNPNKHQTSRLNGSMQGMAWIILTLLPKLSFIRVPAYRKLSSCINCKTTNLQTSSLHGHDAMIACRSLPCPTPMSTCVRAGLVCDRKRRPCGTFRLQLAYALRPRLDPYFRQGRKTMATAISGLSHGLLTRQSFKLIIWNICYVFPLSHL